RLARLCRRLRRGPAASALSGLSARAMTSMSGLSGPQPPSASPPPPTLAVGQRVHLRITDVAFGGDGVGRVDQFVIFVPFVIPGEEVEVEITELKKQYGRARLVRVEQASPERVAPACRYFG